jgi:hypothetical protein
MLKLNEEELSNLQSLLDHEGYKPLLKVLNSQVELQEKEVLIMRLEKDSLEQMAYAKSRAEGAKKFVTAVVKYLTNVKLKDLKRKSV